MSPSAASSSWRWRRPSDRCSTAAAASSTVTPRRRCASSRMRSGIPVVTTLMGIGCADTTAPAVAAHARHAWHRVCQLRGRRLRFPDRGRVRASMTASPACRPSSRRTRSSSRTSTSTRPRSARSSASTGAMSACWPDALKALRAHGSRTGFKADYADWHRHVAELKKNARDELRPQSDGHPAARRDRGDQQADPGRSHRQHRRRPAPDVGRAVLRLSSSRACG